MFLIVFCTERVTVVQLEDPSGGSNQFHNSAPVDVGESELPAANDVPSERMTEPITDELCLIVGNTPV